MSVRTPLRRSSLSAAVLLAMTPSAFAVDFIFSGGVYVPGSTAPEPLVAGQVLQINSGSNKFFSGSTLTNQSGLVNWNADTLFMQNGTLIDNQSVWDAKSDNALVNNGGPLSTFDNSGTFRKGGGLGATTIGSITFVNSGIIDAQTGTINFSGGNATFNAGSQFIGAGSTVVTNNASFNGGFTSSNLTLAGGTFSGSAAQVNGNVGLAGGVLSGSWEVAAGQSLSGKDGSNKFMSSVTLTNNGTVQWQTGDTLFMQNGSSFTNNGLHDIQATSAIVNNGGPLSNYTNSSGATLRVAAGQTATMGSIAFVNNGGTLTANGTFNFAGANASFNSGTLFNGTGTNLVTNNASFNGAISSSNLVLQGGIFSGGSATLSGNTDFTGGVFTGTWEVGSGQVLNGKDGANKFVSGATLTNKGSVQWQSANTLFMQNGSTFDNQGSFDMLAGMALVNNGGPLSSFVNSGTLHVATGQAGSVGSIAYVNNGGNVASDGTLTFGGANATFNSGTSFTGGGTTQVTNNARFVDDFSSQNLHLAGGIFTGGDGSVGSKAVASGVVAFSGGVFAGNWDLANGQSLLGVTGNNKFMSGTQFANKGNVSWQTSDSLFMQNGASFDNQQLFDVQESMALVNNGGPLSTFTNNNRVKVATGKAATVGSLQFINNGVLDVAGTLNFNGGNATFNNGSTFTGAGAVAVNSNAVFNGNQTSTNLSLRNGTFTGTGAVVHGAVEYTGGLLQGDWTVAAGQTLAGRDGSNKFLNGVALTNHGTIAWQTGESLFMQNGAALNNRGLFEIQTGAAILNNGGPLPTFTSSGTLRVAAGQNATIGGIGFVNNAGILDAGAGGSLNFAGGNAAFNAGTQFSGAGINMVTNNAAFNGSFGSTNLSLRSGAFTGSGAVLNGSAEFSGGLLQGGWTVADGATLNGVDGANKFINGGTLTNQGTLAWKSGNSLFFQNGATVANQGTMDLQTDSAMLYNGGPVGSFVNTGLITKTGGSGTSTIGNNLGFDNQGVVDVSTGTIRLPDNFTNNGTLKGVGAFTTNVLTNAGHVAPGSSPGTLTLNGNYLQTAAGFLDTELASSVLFDTFLINGSAQLDGTLALSCVAACDLHDGDMFVILDSTADLSGTFAHVSTLNFGNGFQYDVVYDYNADLVKLIVIHAGTQITTVPEPGTWALMLAGVGVVGSLARRRSRRG